MGFYDKKIKKLYENCPRLAIISINSMLGKNHSIDSRVEYYDKEQLEDSESETYMDMFLGIEGSSYHLEFQLVEDNMAIRMYEYGIKETIREIKHTSNHQDENNYELDVTMPAQAVIFLAGKNKRDKIVVHLTLPDGQMVDYSIPCISASVSIDELLSRGLYILIPFQQVQLNDQMNHIKKRTSKTKLKLAREIFHYHEEIKNNLDKLHEDAILELQEYTELQDAFIDIEEYLTDKDHEVKEEVQAMGDRDYIPYSDRIRAQGEEIGKEIGKEKQLAIFIIKKIKKNNSLEDIAEIMEEDVDVIKPIYDMVQEFAPEYDIQQIEDRIKAKYSE